MAQIKDGGKEVWDSATNNTLNTQRASGMPGIGGDGGNLAVTSTNINVYSNGQRVGYVQSIAPSETRNINKIRELGTEGVIQSVPNNTNGGTLNITRMALYNSSVYNALGLTSTGKFIEQKDIKSNTSNSVLSNDEYKTFSNIFKTLKDQRVPLEIRVETTMPPVREQYKKIVETYLDCWVRSYSKNIASQTITISETVGLEYSDIDVQYL
jgi:hypothetical protein